MQNNKKVFLIILVVLIFISSCTKKEEVNSKSFSFTSEIKEDLSKSFSLDLIKLLPEDSGVILYQNFQSEESKNILEKLRIKEFQNILGINDLARSELKDTLVSLGLIKPETTSQEIDLLLSSESVMFIRGDKVLLEDSNESLSYGLISQSKFSNLDDKSDEIIKLLNKKDNKAKNHKSNNYSIIEFKKVGSNEDNDSPVFVPYLGLKDSIWVVSTDKKTIEDIFNPQPKKVETLLENKEILKLVKKINNTNSSFLLAGLRAPNLNQEANQKFYLASGASLLDNKKFVISSRASISGESNYIDILKKDNLKSVDLEKLSPNNLIEKEGSVISLVISSYFSKLDKNKDIPKIDLLNYFKALSVKLSVRSSSQSLIPIPNILLCGLFQDSLNNSEGDNSKKAEDVEAFIKELMVSSKLVSEEDSLEKTDKEKSLDNIFKGKYKESKVLSNLGEEIVIRSDNTLFCLSNTDNFLIPENSKEVLKFNDDKSNSSKFISGGYLSFLNLSKGINQALNTAKTFGAKLDINNLPITKLVDTVGELGTFTFETKLDEEDIISLDISSSSVLSPPQEP